MTTPESVGLTPQQIKVLQLIAHGYTNRQIAEELRIAEGTAERHVHSLLTILGVHNRTEAALWAVQQGLIALDDDQI